ncbi:uncharacterized protein LOC114373408 [Glycine soja]|uniref:uncharacterized protein LOC114373408 n=1 Tax=Glycine soja TaxID=3848 RepID=UPI000E21B569|nr:uncharacterized protein LOC114373408 [Glycine soja]|eukprot:XP_025980665.1 uncharacterized protein LOC102663233 [Glycine max]
MVLLPAEKNSWMPSCRSGLIALVFSVQFLEIAGLYPKGSPSRNSRRPKINSGPRGGLEIVFNQQ